MQNKPINVHVQKFKLIVPFRNINDVGFANDPGSHTKVECYQGEQNISQYGVGAQGSGAWAMGHITASITSLDYKTIYQVYNLKESESADYWFIHYQDEKSHDQLAQVASQATQVTQNVDLWFMLQGNDYGITSVYIYYTIIRLVINGVNYDFVVTNGNSAGANTPSGTPYPNQFKPMDKPPALRL